MSFTDFREVTNPAAGTTTKYGSQDLLDIMQIFNGKTTSNRRPRIINPWRWDASFDMKEIVAPAAPSTSGYQSLYVDSTTHRLALRSSTGLIQDIGVTGVVSPMVERTGYWIPAGGTTFATVGSLGGMLSQHAAPASVGAMSNIFDTTDGVLIQMASGATSGNAAGIISPTAGVGVGRRLFGARAATRAKIDSTATSKFLFGFTSNSTLPVAAATQPLGTTESGVIVGFVETGTGSTNWTIWHNDGATSVTADNVSGPIAKDANMHSIEINWPASGNVTVLFDNVVQTVTVDLPALTANLFFNMVAVTTTTTARTLSTEGAWIEAYD